MDSGSDRALARLRAMTPAEKLRVSEALWREARTIAEAAIVKRHPEWTRDQVRQENPSCDVWWPSLVSSSVSSDC